MKLTTPFEEYIVYENKKIEFIKNTPAMTAKKTLTKEELEYMKKKQSGYWNTWNLIPTVEEGYGTEVEAEYVLKMLCHLAAKEIPSEYHRLYYEASLVETYEIIMNGRAYNW